MKINKRGIGKEVMSFLLLVVSSVANATPVVGSDPNVVSFALTECRIANDILEFKWIIRNDTRHDVWICNSLNLGTNPVYEQFIDSDNETLVIRKRTDVPILNLEFPPWIARYGRLCPGESRTDFYKSALPLVPYKRSEGEQGHASFAKCLRFEVSYFDEDLPELVLGVIELSKKLSIDPNNVTWDIIRDISPDMLVQYYPGWIISREFERNLGFSSSIRAGTEGADSVMLPYMSGSLQREEALITRVDSVMIPIAN